MPVRARYVVANSEQEARRYMLANLKVSRKLALGLASILVVFAVTGTAFFFTLLAIDRATEEVSAAVGLDKTITRAVSAYEPSNRGRCARGCATSRMEGIEHAKVFNVVHAVTPGC